MQVKLRLISQLINGLSRVFQKLLKYFKDTLFLLSLSRDFPVISTSNWNDLECAILSFGPSL